MEEDKQVLSIEVKVIIFTETGRCFENTTQLSIPCILTESYSSL